MANEKQQADAMLMSADQLTDFVKSIVQEMRAAAPVPAAVPGQKVPVHTRIPAEQKMVEVNLFLDNGKYRDDVYVMLNGKRYNIPRGKAVMVPEGVKEILENSHKQDMIVEVGLNQKAEAWDEKQKSMK